MARAITTELTPAQIQNIAEELEVGSPIMAYRVVGDRVELHLVGGGIATYDQAGEVSTQPIDVEASNPDLELFIELVAGLNVNQLRKAAGMLGIPGANRMKKQLLIEALSKIALETPGTVNTALRSV